MPQNLSEESLWDLKLLIVTMLAGIPMYATVATYSDISAWI